MQQARVNLGDLMVEHKITIRQILQAGAPGPATWSLNLGNPVDLESAQAVIAALNTLCSTNYVLDDIEALLCTNSTPCYLHKPKLPAFTQRG